MIQKTSPAEALMQTPEQRQDGRVTFRVYIDDAWRNIEGLVIWKQLDPQELSAMIEQVYASQKAK